MSTEEKLVKGLTARALVIGLMLSIVLAFALAYTAIPMWSGHTAGAGYGYIQNLYGASWVPGIPMQYMFLPFIAFVIYVIAAPLRKSLNLENAELAVIYTMILVTVTFVWMSPWPNGGSLVFWIVSLFCQLYSGTYGDWYGFTITQQQAFEALGPFALPPPPGIPNLNLPFMVNWGDWAPTLALNSVFMILLSLLFVFWAALFRKPLIEAENLPFPNATIVSSILTGGYSSKKHSLFKSKFFIGGLVLGLILDVPLLLAILGFTWIPTIPTGALTMALDLTNLQIIAWAPIVFCWDPLLIGWSLFISRETLLSFIIAFIAILWIGQPILYSVGALPAWNPGDPGTLIMEYLQWRNPSGWHYTANLAFGVLLAAAIYTLIIHRKTLSLLLKTDKNYRMIGIAVCILAVVYILYGASLGGTPWMIAYSIPLSLLGILGGMRVLGETGFWGLLPVSDTTGTPLSGNMLTNVMYYGLNVNEAGENWYLTNPGGLRTGWVNTTMVATNSPFTHQYHLNPSFATLDAAKIGSVTRTRRMDIIISVAIACTLISIVGLIATVWSTSIWGYSETAWFDDTNGNWFHSTYFAGNRWTWAGWREPIPSIGTSILLIALIVSLTFFFLRRKFIRLSFNPIAIFLVTMVQSPLMFLPAIIGYVTKTVLVRTLGAEAVERVAAPLALGMVVISSGIWLLYIPLEMPFAFGRQY